MNNQTVQAAVPTAASIMGSLDLSAMLSDLDDSTNVDEEDDCPTPTSNQPLEVVDVDGEADGYIMLDPDVGGAAVATDAAKEEGVDRDAPSFLDSLPASDVQDAPRSPESESVADAAAGETLGPSSASGGTDAQHTQHKHKWTSTPCKDSPRDRAMGDNRAPSRLGTPQNPDGLAAQDTPRGRTMSASVGIQALQVTTAGVLSVQHNQSADVGSMLKRLRDNDETLVTFDMSNAQPLKQMDTASRDAKFENIADALRGNSFVTHVGLSNVSATDFCVEEIADALETNKTVTSLNLESNNIKHDGIIALAGMLRKNGTLKRLQLRNQAGAISARAQHRLADTIAASNTNMLVCSADFHDATAREKLEKALARNMEACRVARVASEKAMDGDAAAVGVTEPPVPSPSTAVDAPAPLSGADVGVEGPLSEDDDVLFAQLDEEQLNVSEPDLLRFAPTCLLAGEQPVQQHDSLVGTPSPWTGRGAPGSPRRRWRRDRSSDGSRG